MARARWVQRYPWILDVAYEAMYRGLWPIRRWLTRHHFAERFFTIAEKATKGPVFGCVMCGQCVLHSTGMTCPMTCPKNLRNGPCGGVRQDGHCEVVPSMPCVWVQAWERSLAMPLHGRQILRVVPPLDRRLQGTSAWINDLAGRSRAPIGWDE